MNGKLFHYHFIVSKYKKKFNTFILTVNLVIRIKLIHKLNKHLWIGILRIRALYIFYAIA